MNDTANSLAQLKDIQLPPAISWWPPAPGWYILLGLSLLILIIAGIMLWHHWQKKQQQHSIQAQWQAILTQYQQHHDKQRCISEISIFIRRMTLAHYPRREIAGLEGKAWLAFLDKTLDHDSFSNGIGELLITGPYQPYINEDLDELFILIETWMKKIHV